MNEVARTIHLARNFYGPYSDLSQAQHGVLARTHQSPGLPFLPEECGNRTNAVCSSSLEFLGKVIAVSRLFSACLSSPTTSSSAISPSKVQGLFDRTNRRVCMGSKSSQWYASYAAPVLMLLATDYYSRESYLLRRYSNPTTPSQQPCLTRCPAGALTPHRYIFQRIKIPGQFRCFLGIRCLQTRPGGHGRCVVAGCGFTVITLRG